MLGWSFFVLCNSSLSRSIFYMKLGPSKQVWVGRPRGRVCLLVEVGGGDGFHFYWFSLLITLLITPVRVYQFLHLSSSIGFIEYCWLVSDFYFYYCHDSDLFQHDEKFQNDERTMFFDMLPYVCLSDLLPIIIWALRRCSRIYAGFSLGLVNHQNVPDPTLMGIEGCSPQCRPSWN